MLESGGESGVLFLLLLCNGFAQFAGVLPAKRHLDCLGQRDHFGIFPNHVGPRGTLQDRPLAAAGKGECDENHEEGKTAHERLIR